MHNPWLDISLQDYEGHMSLPSIGQAQMLAEQFERLMKRELPSSVAVIGCAGGNGLDRIAAGAVGRVVAVDINREYIDETSRRYSNRLPCLDLHCADVQSNTLRFEPVDLIYAALLFEYVDLSSALATLKRNCRPGGVLAAVLQLPHPDKDAVSPSPYTSLQALAPLMKLVAPAELSRHAARVGFTADESSTVELPSGKQFWLQTFRL